MFALGGGGIKKSHFEDLNRKSAFSTSPYYTYLNLGDYLGNSYLEIKDRGRSNVCPKCLIVHLIERGNVTRQDENLFLSRILRFIFLSGVEYDETFSAFSTYSY